MECLGPQCASMVLDWLKSQAAGSLSSTSSPSATSRQGMLWTAAPYQEDAPLIRSASRAGRGARAPALRRLPEVSEPVDPCRTGPAGQHD